MHKRAFNAKTVYFCRLPFVGFKIFHNVLQKYNVTCMHMQCFTFIYIKDACIQMVHIFYVHKLMKVMENECKI